MTKRNITLLYLVCAVAFFLDAAFLSYVKFFSESVVLPYLSQFADLFLVVFVPSVCLCACEYKNAGLPAQKEILPALFSALPTFFYAFPLLYADLFAEGYGTDGALLFSFLIALGVTLVLAFVSFLLLLTANRTAARHGRFSLSGNPFDLQNPAVLLFSVSAALPFLLFFITEIADIVLSVIDYYGSLTPGEVVYMAARFVYIPLSYLLTVFLIPKIIKIFKAKDTQS